MKEGCIMYDFFSLFAEVNAAHSAIINADTLSADDVYYIRTAISNFIDMVKDFDKRGEMSLEQATEEHYS